MSVGERAHNKTMAAMRVQASFVPTHPTTSTQSELSFCRRAETRPLARLLMHEKGLCWRGLGINKRAIAARWQKEHCVMEHTHTNSAILPLAASSDDRPRYLLDQGGQLQRISNAHESPPTNPANMSPP